LDVSSQGKAPARLLLQTEVPIGRSRSEAAILERRCRERMSTRARPKLSRLQRCRS